MRMHICKAGENVAARNVQDLCACWGDKLSSDGFDFPAANLDIRLVGGATGYVNDCRSLQVRRLGILR